MNKYFQIKNCPLCQKLLTISYTGYQQKYMCPYMFTYTRETEWGMNLTEEKSHYIITVDGAFTTQTSIIQPYMIVSTSGTNKSKIYDLFSNKLIMETPMIIPDNSEKLFKKIKILIPFS